MNAWLHDALPFWPLLLGAVAYVELSAFLSVLNMRRCQVAVAVALFALLVGWQDVSQPAFVTGTQATPMTLLLTTIWIAAVPLVVLTVGAHLFAGVHSVLMRHVGLVALSGVVVAVLPVFAILSLCTSGVYCV